MKFLNLFGDAVIKLGQGMTLVDDYNTTHTRPCALGLEQHVDHPYTIPKTWVRAGLVSWHVN